MYFTTALFTALAATGVVAIPTKTLTKRIDPGSQSCTAVDQGDYSTWTDYIGNPFNTNACNDLYDALEIQTGVKLSPTNWECVDDGAGSMKITFDYPHSDEGAGGIINAAFASVYPPADGYYGTVNGFNCPDA